MLQVHSLAGCYPDASQLVRAPTRACRCRLRLAYRLYCWRYSRRTEAKPNSCFGWSCQEVSFSLGRREVGFLMVSFKPVALRSSRSMLRCRHVTSRASSCAPGLTPPPPRTAHMTHACQRDKCLTDCIVFRPVRFSTAACKSSSGYEPSFLCLPLFQALHISSVPHLRQR